MNMGSPAQPKSSAPPSPPATVQISTRSPFLNQGSDSVQQAVLLKLSQLNTMQPGNANSRLKSENHKRLSTKKHPSPTAPNSQNPFFAKSLDIYILYINHTLHSMDSLWYHNKGQNEKSSSSHMQS